MNTTITPSLAELLHRVGDVPLERIVFDPAPGTATIADVQRLCDGDAKLRCELVDAVLVKKVSGFRKGVIQAFLAYHIGTFVKLHESGVMIHKSDQLSAKTLLEHTMINVVLVGRSQSRRQILWVNALLLSCVLGTCGAIVASLVYFGLSGRFSFPATAIGFCGPFIVIGSGIQRALMLPLEQLTPLANSAESHHRS